VGTFSVLFGLFAHSVVSKPAANPQITPAPLVKRDQALIGYYSVVVDATTQWVAHDCKPSYTVTTSGDFWRCCDPAIGCPFATACAGTLILGVGNVVDCNSAYDVPNSAIVTNAFCSYDFLYASLGATSSQTYFWCGTPGLTGTDNYIATTSGPSTPSSPTTTPSSPTTSAPPPPPVQPIKKSGTSTGAIAGGVVGGLAVIGAAAVAIFFLCGRKRNKTAAQPGTTPDAGQGTKYFKAEGESLSPHSNVSGWGAASPATVHESMYKDPNAHMSTSTSPEPAMMYMSQPMHQMPMQQAPMQQMHMQPMYQQPIGGPQELS